MSPLTRTRVAIGQLTCVVMADFDFIVEVVGTATSLKC